MFIYCSWWMYLVFFFGIISDSIIIHTICIEFLHTRFFLMSHDNQANCDWLISADASLAVILFKYWSFYTMQSVTLKIICSEMNNFCIWHLCLLFCLLCQLTISKKETSTLLFRLFHNKFFFKDTIIFRSYATNFALIHQIWCPQRNLMVICHLFIYYRRFTDL